MAKPVQITVGLRRLYKHPFEDFENFSIEAAVTMELNPGEAPEDAAKIAFPILRKQMIETYREFKPRRNPPKESK